MREGTFTVVNKLGLHARPAARICGAAEKFSCLVEFQANGTMANAKSILGLLILGAHKGVQIRVICKGDDPEEEARALAAMGNLIETAFGEG